MWAFDEPQTTVLDRRVLERYPKANDWIRLSVQIGRILMWFHCNISEPPPHREQHESN